MRLTLRTLLAYIDDVLDPRDAQELSKRVEASDFANDLIHRTRDTMRRLRLAAPPLDEGSDSGVMSENWDANAMAEYLDNTLSPEKVAEFERRCLESDEHLAEAASCHHILTMVLGERAEVDPDMRRRMFALREEVAARVAKADSAAVADTDLEPADAAPVPAPTLPANGATAPMPPEPASATPASGVVPSQTPAPLAASAEPATPANRHQEVPDYLKTSKRSYFGKLFPAIAALLLLGFTAYAAFGPDGFLVAKNDEPGIAEPSIVEPMDDELINGDSEPEDVEGSTDVEEPLGEDAPGDSAATPDILTEQPLEEPITTEPNLTEPALEPTIATAEPPSNEAMPEQPVSPDVGPDAAAVPGIAGNLGEPSDEASEGESLPVEPAAPQPFGSLISNNEVLLQFGQETNVWNRLAPRTEITSSTRLLSLPTYRPVVSLRSGLTLDMTGPTVVRLDEAAGSKMEIELVYGKLILTNPLGSEETLMLTLGQLSGELSLGPNAYLAVELQRSFQPGIDPRVTPAPLAAVCFAKGNVRWAAQVGERAVDQLGSWAIVGESLGPVDSTADEPAWLRGGVSAGFAYEDASEKVEDQLATDVPIWEQLTAISGSKLKEQRALAIVSSVHIGLFEPFIKSIGDSDQRSEWKREIEMLRYAMAQSPQLAEAMYQSLQDVRGERAEDLYSMLCGYSPEDVGESPEEQRVGILRQLIDWMDSDQPDYRVLANFNFSQITGLEAFFPAGLKRTRDITIRNYRSRLEEGELRVKESW